MVCDCHDAQHTEYSLFKHIDIPHVVALNGADDNGLPSAPRGSNGSIASTSLTPVQQIFKPFDNRFEELPYLESDCDQELIIFIPFTGCIKLKSIAILGGPGEKAPATMKAYVNREDVDFDTVQNITPDQEWELINMVPGGVMPEYPTKIAKFSNVRNVTLYIPKNFSDDDDETTRISYIGFKGEYTEFTRDPIITMYEAAANPADHKTKVDNKFGSMIQ